MLSHLTAYVNQLLKFCSIPNVTKYIIRNVIFNSRQWIRTDYYFVYSTIEGKRVRWSWLNSQDIACFKSSCDIPVKNSDHNINKEFIHEPIRIYFSRKIPKFLKFLTLLCVCEQMFEGVLWYECELLLTKFQVSRQIYINGALLYRSWVVPASSDFRLPEFRLWLLWWRIKRATEPEQAESHERVGRYSWNERNLLALPSNGDCSWLELIVTIALGPLTGRSSQCIIMISTRDRFDGVLVFHWSARRRRVHRGRNFERLICSIFKVTWQVMDGSVCARVWILRRRVADNWHVRSIILSVFQKFQFSWYYSLVCKSLSSIILNIIFIEINFRVQYNFIFFL